MWGWVEGIVDASTATHPVDSIELYDPAGQNYQGRVSLLGVYSAKPDSDRHFTFEHVPPGENSVFINSLLRIPYHHQTPIVVNSGERTSVTIAERAGALVRGRFTSGTTEPLNWEKYAGFAQLELADLRPPITSADELKLKAVEFWTSPAGREYINTPRIFALRIDNDGSFVCVERVPPGNYDLVATLQNLSTRHRVAIGPEYVQTEVDVGTLTLR